VKALRDREELGVARDHDPIDPDPHPTRIAEQGAQHLCDASALPGRAHAHDAPAADELPKLDARGQEGGQALIADDRLEPAWVERHDLHGVAR